MTDLAAFLRARLYEDEQMALDAIGGQVDISAPTATHLHILRWSSKRVLAEVKAKRSIVTDFESWGAAPDRLTNPGTLLHWMALRNVMYALAEVYQDHPDYAAVVDAMRNTV